MNKRAVVLIVVLALSVTVFLFVLGNPPRPSEDLPGPKESKGQGAIEDASISHFFENMIVDEEGQAFISPRPTGKKVDCVLEGIKMQEGTVSSDTVCVSQP